ncbi:MAG TPA: hypothetical protein VIY28_07150, partial [Pseudonocardiaceae bacterium]
TAVTMGMSAEPAESSDEQLVRQLVDRARAEGLKLTGEGGLLGRLTKAAWGVVKFPATKCHVINFALVAACSPKPSWYESHSARNDRERLAGHPGREFEASSGCVRSLEAGLIRTAMTYPRSGRGGADVAPPDRAGSLIGDRGWVTSGRATFRVTCRMFGGEAHCGKAWCAKADLRLVGSDGEDNAWRRTSVFGFCPLPPTGLSRGGPGQVVVVSGLPALVIPTE